jgi:hypothetical protein
MHTRTDAQYVRTVPSSACSVELTAQSLVGLLCAAARVDRLPARGWALESALDALDRIQARETAAIKRVVARWPRGLGGVVPRFQGADEIIRELARAGHLSPAGEGWGAGWVPNPGWVASHERLALALSTADRMLLRRAAQGLNAALVTWSKKAVASGPVGSATT